MKLIRCMSLHMPLFFFFLMTQVVPHGYPSPTQLWDLWLLARGLTDYDEQLFIHKTYETTGSCDEIIASNIDGILMLLRRWCMYQRQFLLAHFDPIALTWGFMKKNSFTFAKTEILIAFSNINIQNFVRWIFVVFIWIVFASQSKKRIFTCGLDFVNASLLR